LPQDLGPQRGCAGRSWESAGGAALPTRLAGAGVPHG